MKLLRVKEGNYVFELGKREQEALVAVLRLYPVIPSAHHTLSKNPVGPEQQNNQRLLDEALAEQRRENKKQLEALLNDSARFKQTARGCRMTLSTGEVEWLLQVLNDVRVGSWILMGSPDDWPEPKPSDPWAPHVFATQLAGFFEMELLTALQQSPS